MMMDQGDDEMTKETQVSSLISGWQVTTVDCGHQPFIIISLSLPPAAGRTT
jgi:hypothetical protein